VKKIVLMLLVLLPITTQAQQHPQQKVRLQTQSTFSNAVTTERPNIFRAQSTVQIPLGRSIQIETGPSYEYRKYQPVELGGLATSHKFGWVIRIFFGRRH
jgi:hypothetical protein